MERLTDKESGFIEGYAQALQDIQKRLTGENDCMKSYDPLTVTDNGRTMRSYAFDMKEGGRSHSVAGYKSIDEITNVLFDETMAHLTS